ncbi:hypothetical protein Save01_02234 [Streptomyces avermitilis]
MSRVPVSLETIGIRGAPKVSPAAIRRNSVSIPSMCGEWNAWLTRSRFVLRPRAAQCAATASTASSSPAITVEAGPFSAARVTDSETNGASSSSVAWTDTIAPVAGRSCISRPRAATSVQASARERTPATCAAASSPTE